MSDPSSPFSNYAAQQVAAQAARNPSTQPTSAGLSDADTLGMLEYVFPPLALIPNTQDFIKQVLSPVMPAVSGIEGAVTGGLANGLQGARDGARAGWQAQSQAQDAYAAQNPAASAAADLVFPIGAADAVKYAGKAGTYGSQALPDLTKAIMSDPANAQALTAAQQAASGAANLKDKYDQGSDVYEIGKAWLQSLFPDSPSYPAASPASQSLPDPTELPRLPGSPPPISLGPPSWVPMLPPSDAPVSSVNLDTPDYLKPGWSYDGPQIESPVNLVPGMTISGDYGGGGGDEDADED